MEDIFYGIYSIPWLCFDLWCRLRLFLTSNFRLEIEIVQAEMRKFITFNRLIFSSKRILDNSFCNICNLMAASEKFFEMLMKHCETVWKITVGQKQKKEKTDDIEVRQSGVTKRISIAVCH